MKKSTILIPVTAAFLGCFLCPLSLPAADTSGYFRIDSLDLDASDTDLSAPIERVVGEADIVALGEAIHTSGGLHKSIARSAKYLIVRKDFRAVAIETPWKGVELLNRYVDSCRGSEEASIDEALNGIFPQFRSNELADLFRFICQHNASNPDDKVVVFGFDMQQWGFDAQPHAYDARAIIEFFEAVDPAAAERFAEGLQACGGDRGAGNVPGPFTAAEYQACQSTVDNLVSFFAENEERLVRMASRSAVELVLISLEVQRFWPTYAYFIGQASQHPQGSPEANKFLRQAMNTRDHGMARVFVKARKAYASHAKTILLGHTGHFAHQGEKFMDFVDKTMGSWLDDYYGSTYRVIGAIAHRLVRADWWTNEDIYVPEGDAAEVWLEAQLTQLGNEFAFVDTKRNEVIAPGMRYTLSNGGFGVPADHFDGLFFMVESSAMTSVE